MNRAAYLICLCGNVLCPTDVFEEHFCYSDGMSLICTQGACDTKIVADRTGLQTAEWRLVCDKVRVFRNLGQPTPTVGNECRTRTVSQA